MKPAAFAYLRADSAPEAVAALAAHGEGARILAGGQSLLAVLNMRLAQPELLIDISRAGDLNQMTLRDGGSLHTGGSRRDGSLEIGAAVTQASLEQRATLAAEVPLLALALPWVAHIQVRNRGTVCGSIAHADPSAELPLVLIALAGEVVLASQAGERTVAAKDFFQGMLLTARRPDELLRAVRFPLAIKGCGYGFAEFGMRHGDFAIAAVAAVVSADRVRVTVGGVADRPTVGEWPRSDDPDQRLNDLAWSLAARDDLHASAKLRRNLIRELGRRVIDEAATRRNEVTK